MNKPKILGVDDSKDVLVRIAERLSPEFDVILVDHENAYADALLKWAADDELEMALVDLRIPDENGEIDDDKDRECEPGLRLIEQMKQRRDSNIIAYSALDPRVVEHRAKRSGASKFVPKGKGGLEAVALSFCAFQSHRAMDAYCKMVSDPRMLAAHGGECVAILRDRIWGKGENFDAAWADAANKPGHPERWQLQFIVVPEEKWWDARSDTTASKLVS